MEPVKIGVIGCGVIGSVNLKDAMASDCVKVVAAADLRESRRAWAREQGVPRIYEDGRELLDSDPEVEAVIIAFPAAGRTAMALRAFARGKHVLIEKPVAVSVREVRSMMQARGSLVAGCFSSRFRLFESAMKAREVVDEGRLGRLRRLHVRVLLPGGGVRADHVPPPWRESHSMNGGGILVNWGCYDLDYVLGIAGWTFKPKLVLARTWPCVPAFSGHVAPESDAEAWYSAFVCGEDGTVLTVERGEFMPIAGESAWQLIGTKGALRAGMLNGPDRQIVLDEANTKEGVVSTVVWDGKDTLPGGNPAAIENFALAIREGHPVATGLEEALTMTRITEGIYRSAETGTAVTV